MLSTLTSMNFSSINRYQRRSTKANRHERSTKWPFSGPPIVSEWVELNFLKVLKFSNVVLRQIRGRALHTSHRIFSKAGRTFFANFNSLLAIFLFQIYTEGNKCSPNCYSVIYKFTKLSKSYSLLCSIGRVCSALSLKC